MDNLNRVVSFVLGLIVVIVFLAVITGRLNLKGRILSSNKATPTITPTTVVTRYPTVSLQGVASQKVNQGNSGAQIKTPTTIPSTGSPTLLIPLLFFAFAGGILLKTRYS